MSAFSDLLARIRERGRPDAAEVLAARGPEALPIASLFAEEADDATFHRAADALVESHHLADPRRLERRIREAGGEDVS